MNKRNLVLQAALALAFAGAAGVASAAATVTGTPIDFAKETCQATTVYTLPVVTYAAGVAAIQDFYVTFTLTNGTFTANPTATVTNVAAGGTATQVAGGTGSSSVTFRIDASASAWAIADSVALDAGATATATSCASPIVVSAANGLLFISGAVASPLETVAAADVDGTEEIATFTQAVTIAMAETGTDPIDLNPTPSSNSRLVFGPTASLDGAVAGNAAETTTMLTRRLAITVGAQREPDNSAAFADVIDDLVISLQAPFDTSSITSLCMDDNSSSTCQAGESFDLTTGVATIAGGSWATNLGFLLNNDGTAFAPRTLTLDYALSVKTNAVRPGMTAHTYSYTAPANNDWSIAYANGTLLRSAWFLVDAANSSVMRLVNAGTSAAAVVDTTYYLDSGATGSMVGVDDLGAQAGDNTAINATSIPDLGTGTASRGYIEVVVAGDLGNVDGQLINSNTTALTRTVVPMRNVTFDTGIRNGVATPF